MPGTFSVFVTWVRALGRVHQLGLRLGTPWLPTKIRHFSRRTPGILAGRPGAGRVGEQGLNWVMREHRLQLFILARHDDFGRLIWRESASLVAR